MVAAPFHSNIVSQFQCELYCNTSNPSFIQAINSAVLILGYKDNLYVMEAHHIRHDSIIIENDPVMGLYGGYQNRDSRVSGLITCPVTVQRMVSSLDRIEDNVW
jgi:hypothetical protein